MTRRQKAFAGVAALVGCLLVAWYLGLFQREEQFVAELKTLAAEKPSQENRDAVRDLMRKQFDGVPQEQRAAMFEQLAPIFIPLMAKRFEQEYDRFMALPAAEQQKELDKRIDEMEKRRKSGQGPPGPGGGGNGQRPSAAQIDAFRKKMLDWTTPDQRSKFENGMAMLNNRRQERGLPPLEGPQ